MTQKHHFTLFFQEHKALFIILAVALFLIELEIFALSAMKSGKKSLLQVYDNKGNVIYETDGRQLSDFNKYYFEQTFGPFEDYDVKLITNEVKFPFRAWFAAAIGIPFGIILMLAFAIKAFRTIFYGEEKKTSQLNTETSTYETRFEKIIAQFSRFNIFIIGTLVFLSALSFWIVPNLFTYVGKVGIETLTEYKWIFLAIGVIITSIFIWIIYLRYLIAKKTIESRLEVDKYRIQIELSQNHAAQPQLEYTIPEDLLDSKQTE